MDTSLLADLLKLAADTLFHAGAQMVHALGDAGGDEMVHSRALALADGHGSSLFGVEVPAHGSDAFGMHEPGDHGDALNRGLPSRLDRRTLSPDCDALCGGRVRR